MHTLVTVVAKYFIFLALIITGLIWLKLTYKQKLEFIAFILLAGIFALIFAKIGGHIINDPRPFVTGHFTPYFTHSADNGFPSDHMLLGAVIAFMALRYDRRLGGVVLALALLVGIARIIAGIHHVEDILGSILFAALGYGLSNLILAWYKKSKSPPHRGPTTAGH